AQEVRVSHTRNLNRVLHREKQTCLRSLVCCRLGDVLAIEQDLTLRDLVTRMARHCVCKRGLAGAIRPHDRVGLALLNGQVYTLKDLLGTLLGLNTDVKVLDFQNGAHCSISFVTLGSIYTSPSSISTT